MLKSDTKTANAKTTESELSVEQMLPIADVIVSNTKAIDTIDNAYGVEGE